MKISFEDYCEEYLDMHLCLMTSAEKAEAYAYFIAKPAVIKAVKHRDASMNIAALKAKCARLVASQKIAIERSSFLNQTAIESVKIGESLLAMKKVSRAAFHAHTDLNSEASRIFNVNKGV